MSNGAPPASERTYTELEVMAIMISMRDLHRDHPNAHYTLDRDEVSGRIIGWKLSAVQPSSSSRSPRPPSPLTQPDPGIAMGHGFELDTPQGRRDAALYLGIIVALFVAAALVIVLF